MFHALRQGGNKRAFLNSSKMNSARFELRKFKLLDTLPRSSCLFFQKVVSSGPWGAVATTSNPCFFVIFFSFITLKQSREYLTFNNIICCQLSCPAKVSKCDFYYFFINGDNSKCKKSGITFFKIKICFSEVFCNRNNIGVVS